MWDGACFIYRAIIASLLLQQHKPAREFAYCKPIASVYRREAGQTCSQRRLCPHLLKPGQAHTVALWLRESERKKESLDRGSPSLFAEQTRLRLNGTAATRGERKLSTEKPCAPPAKRGLEPRVARRTNSSS